MKAQEQVVSSSLPRVPVARLVGHEGPVQTIRFTGTRFTVALVRLVLMLLYHVKIVRG